MVRQLQDVGESQSHVVWAGRDGAAVAVRVDVPATEFGVGATIFVPSFGLEAASSYRTTVAFGVAAAKAGFIALSPSLAGDGDSQGLDDGDDIVDRWLNDVKAAIDLASESCKGVPIHLVGLRLGGCLLEQIDDPRVSLRIAWEPVSGKRFVNNQMTLRRIGQRTSDFSLPGKVEFNGVALTHLQIMALERLRIPESSIEKNMVVRREHDRDSARRIANAPGFGARIPKASISSIVDSLPRGASVPIVDMESQSSICMRAENGGLVKETSIRIGPHLLAGVITEPVDRAPADVAVYFTAQGPERRCGPGSIWAQLARNLASERGVVSLRLDRRYLGDDTDPTDPYPPLPYTPEAVDDVRVGTSHLRNYAAADVVAVSSCAGAWALLAASPISPISEIVAFSPVYFGLADFSRHSFNVDGWLGRPTDSTLREPPERKERRWPALRNSRLHRMLLPIARVVNEWKTAWRSGSLGFPVLRHSRVGSRCLLVLNHDDYGRYRLLGGKIASLNPFVKYIVTDSLDHSLLTAEARQAVEEIVVRIVVARSSGSPTFHGQNWLRAPDCREPTEAKEPLMSGQICSVGPYRSIVGGRSVVRMPTVPNRAGG